ncbi:MAG: RICIN domain-containing protein [Myxococcota bacterium]
MHHRICWLSLAALIGCEEGAALDTATDFMVDEVEMIPISSPCSVGVEYFGSRYWPVSASGSCSMSLGMLDGQYIRIVNERSGKCMDVAGGSTADNAAINQYTCHTGWNQVFLVDASAGYFGGARLIPALTVTSILPKCLDIEWASTSNGADLQQYLCTGVDNQLFDWNASDSELTVDHSGKCIDVPGGSTSSGVRLQQYDCHGGTNQKWEIHSLTTGYVY